MARNTDSTPPSTTDRAQISATADQFERDAPIDATGAADVVPAGEPESDRSDDESDGDATPTERAAADRCAACGTTIGPREYRLSWVLGADATGPETRYHYCSEACFPDEAPTKGSGSTSDDPPSSRDWSYCR